jgi:hypothetical protein
MSCRIERLAIGTGRAVFRVSGHFQSEYVDAIQELIEREGRPIEFDLSEITLVDREAVSYLAVCERKGVALTNCPPFLRDWIAGIRPTTA